MTHLLTDSDCDALEQQMIARSSESLVWLAALELLREHRTASFQRRAKLATTTRRKTLGLRYSR